MDKKLDRWVRPGKGIYFVILFSFCALAFLADLCRSVESAERIHSDGSGTQASRLEKISSVYHDSEVGLVISKKRMTTVTGASPAIAKLNSQM